MKKKVLVLFFSFVLIFALAACSGAEEAPGTAGEGESPVRPGAYEKGGYDVSGDVSGREGYVVPDGYVSEDGATGAEGDGAAGSAGQITASAWNDNDHYADWIDLFKEGTDNDPAGKFFQYTENEWAFDTFRRVKVTVKSENKPVFGAELSYYDDAQRAWKARTDATGVGYLFPQADEGTIVVKSGESESRVSFTAENRELEVELGTAEEKASVIKLMLVVDVTGSMGDELQFLQTELADVIARVAEGKQVRIDLALLFYRDDGDEEKFLYSDFVTVNEGAGLNAQLAVLKEQEPLGGGDYPEAVDEAAEMAVNKDWGEENSTRIIFFVLDAPPHEEKEHFTRCVAAAGVAAEKGIRICPVLCSGADDLCEYVVRQGAVFTGGTFVYVTDDSGIGFSHHDPDLPEDVPVEYLNDLMVRLVDGYYTGDFGTPKEIERKENEPEQQVPDEEGEEDEKI